MLAKLRPWIDKNGPALAVALLFAAGIFLYANSFGNRMFWDDDDSILNNRYVHDWRYLPKYFSENLIAGVELRDNYWRPMLLLTYSVEWHLWRGWAPGYHLVNTLFHIGDAVLLYFILSRLFRDKRLAWLTSLVFLAHPLQTEAVTYVAGLGDSLSVMFIFIGLLQYLKWRESGRPSFAGGRYWAAVAMYALALMSKETAIVMPAYVLIADVLRSSAAPTGWKRRVKDVLLAILPFLALAGLYLLLRATVLNFINTFNLYNEVNDFTGNFSYRLFTFFRVLSVYAGLLFLPLGLHMERTVEIAKSLWSPDVAAGGAIFAGLLAAAFGAARKYPVISFGAFWVLIGLAPTSNLVVPINGMIYEHWLYLPLVGVFLALIWLGLRLARRRTIKWLLAVLFGVFLLYLCVLTMARNRVWHDPITFYNDVLRYNQASYRIFNNLGNAYSDVKDHDRAVETYHKAIELDPDNAVGYFNLGNTHRDAGRIGEALENYHRAVALSPDVHFYSNNLAALYLKIGKRPEARKVLEEYVSHAVYKNNALISLAMIAADQGDFEAAADYLDQAALADPADSRVEEMQVQIRRFLGR